MKRGRKSAASLAVISVSQMEAVDRPDAPYDLTNEQAEEWWAIVNRMPADWFTRETHPLLAQYCRHIVAARKVARMIEALEQMIAKDAEGEAQPGASALEAAKTMDRLLKMQEREGRAISSLATKMRISQQATLTKRADTGTNGARKPWEFK